MSDADPSPHPFGAALDEAHRFEVNGDFHRAIQTLLVALASASADERVAIERDLAARGVCPATWPHARAEYNRWTVSTARTSLRAADRRGFLTAVPMFLVWIAVLTVAWQVRGLWSWWDSVDYQLRAFLWFVLLLALSVPALGAGFKWVFESNGRRPGNLQRWANRQAFVRKGGGVLQKATVVGLKQGEVAHSSFELSGAHPEIDEWKVKVGWRDKNGGSREVQLVHFYGRGEVPAVGSDVWVRVIPGWVGNNPDPAMGVAIEPDPAASVTIASEVSLGTPG